MKKTTTDKLNIKCYACGFSMSGNGFCDRHATSGVGYLLEGNEIEIQDKFITNNEELNPYKW